MVRFARDCVLVFLCGFFFSNLVFAQCGPVPFVLTENGVEGLWNDDFEKQLLRWGNLNFQFGVENIEFLELEGDAVRHVLRVHYPKGSYDPGSALKGLAPLGGVQFTSRFDGAGVASGDQFVLTYSVRFKDDFDFVRGGKLPGLYGGIPRSGSQIPNGVDGYSTRIVWQNVGRGALYAYLPTSVTMGTLFGAGAWFFRPGYWTEVSQYVKLNTPGFENGEVAIWVDGRLVHQSCGLRYRDVATLKIDGVFFSTFFGGNDVTWASTSDTYVDFSGFKLRKLRSDRD